jgi:hypothetical protein
MKHPGSQLPKYVARGTVAGGRMKLNAGHAPCLSPRTPTAHLGIRSYGCIRTCDPVIGQCSPCYAARRARKQQNSKENRRFLEIKNIASNRDPSGSLPATSAGLGAWVREGWGTVVSEDSGHVGAGAMRRRQGGAFRRPRGQQAQQGQRAHPPPHHAKWAQAAGAAVELGGGCEAETQGDHRRTGGLDAPVRWTARAAQRRSHDRPFAQRRSAGFLLAASLRQPHVDCAEPI